MQRRILTLIFAFLLLVLQWAEHAHALEHLGDWFQHGARPSTSPPRFPPAFL